MSIFHLKPLRGQTDEQLMTRAAAGSDTAFEELYRRYARRLKGFFFMQLGGDEELAQVVEIQHDTIMQQEIIRDTIYQTRTVTRYVDRQIAQADTQSAEVETPSATSSHQMACSMLCDDIPYDLLAQP